jgi:Domain of unknown function (DUF1707)
VLAARASDSDRERAADVLKAAFAEGRLAQDEYAERINFALRSRTYGELAALTTDLPGGQPAVSIGAAVPATTETVPRFDLAAVILSVISVALAVGFFKNFGESPLELVGAIIVSIAASARARRGPDWERVVVWGVSGLSAAFLVGLVLAVLLDLPV